MRKENYLKMVEGWGGGGGGSVQLGMLFLEQGKLVKSTIN